ncbi:hypothetical protein [Fibrella aquatilis]|uniref:Uncharacterized protein n=1 Tax=Fibrella aquatilis TaxID=2817059 RepID=A0A939GBI3_9BACT|nr:hypothetical protein [Fibrella aquatilis]MBO0933348.1 hypothetical protein [Fibrella aquatilis]
MAQSLGGTSWQGTLTSAQNTALAYPSTITFRVEGTQLTGSIIMEAQGLKELYVLQGIAQGGQAAGTATYPKDGSVFQFEAQLNGAQLAFGVGLNNTPIMAGMLSRLGAGGRAAAPQAQRSTPTAPNDRLPRDGRLVGVWAHTSSYRSEGLHASTRTLLYFFPDGRLGSGGGQALASYDGADGSSSLNTGADGVNVEQGLVWYTKGNQIWLHATQQKVPDQVWGQFVLSSNGQGMHLNRGTGNVLYERTQ